MLFQFLKIIYDNVIVKAMNTYGCHFEALLDISAPFLDDFFFSSFEVSIALSIWHS